MTASALLERIARVLPHAHAPEPDELAAFEAEAARGYASMIGDDLPRAELLAQQRRASGRPHGNTHTSE
jgi:hypothetical protein